MATATYFNIHEILEANPSVGYKIQHSEQGPRVVLFTNHFGTTLDDCIETALNVAKAHRLAVARGRQANTDVLVNYRGVSFSVKPGMEPGDAERAYKKAAHRHRVGDSIHLAFDADTMAYAQ